MKLNLSNITGGYGATSTLNANFDAIEAAIENTLSRDGTTPNEMGSNLDMNGNDILNVNELDCETLYLNGNKVIPNDYTVENIFITNSFTSTSGQTVFDVISPIEYNNSVLVTVNGVTLSPSQFSTNGTTVVLASAPLTGSTVVVRRFIKKVYAISELEYRFENNSVFDLSFSVGNSRNAMSAGPITILSGVVVTIPTGSSWHII